MRSRCLESYVYRLGLNGIVTFDSKFWEESSGNENEFVKEEIVCIEGGTPYRMVIQTKYYCGWQSGKSPSVNILEKQPISRERYDQLVLDKGGIEDTPEYRKTREAIIKLRKELEDLVPKCPICKAPMEPKSGPHGEFFGCARYPKCNGTKKMDAGYKEQEETIYARIKELEGS